MTPRRLSNGRRIRTTKHTADTKDCSGNTSGFAKKTDTQYIAYSITGDSDYPGEETCARHVHGDAQIDDLRVNNDLTVSGTINGTTTGNKLVASLIFLM